MNESAIRLSNVSKVYKLYKKPVDRLKEVINPFGTKYHKDFFALGGITAEFPSKQAIGIIGTNGSGKSTLLKIICGVLTPTDGSVEVNGKVSALLELGAGFNLEYTGIENIYLNGTLLGYSQEEMEEKVPQICSFADIGDFIDQPVKTYSSGMFARLAFAVSINVDPDILIVDEALSVGDIRFQQKCFRKMEEMKENKTVIMVSHDMGAICKFCDKVLWIEKGELKAYGEPVEVVKQYQAYLMESRLQEANAAQNSDKPAIDQDIQLDMVSNKHQCYGNGASEILGAGIYDAKTGKQIEYISGGQEVSIYIRIKHNVPIENAIVGVTFFDRLGNDIFGLNNCFSGENLDAGKGITMYVCNFTMPDLNGGPYTVSPAVAEGIQSDHIMRHWVYDLLTFQIVTPFQMMLPGVLAPREFSFHKA